MSKTPKGPPPAPSNAHVEKPAALKPQATSTSVTHPGNSATEQRTLAVKEILSTEESYHKALESIVKLYIEPLNTTEKKLLNPNEVKVIFGQSEMLWRFHTEFLKELTPVIKNWSSTASIGNIFEKNADVFKLYTPYVNSYPDGAYMLAEKQKKDKALNAFLREQQLKTMNKLDLASLLIMPIQRVPRYRMLLEVILKNTQPTHPDYASLANALEKIKVVADAINEKKKKAEMIQKVTEIQDQFDDDIMLVESFRVFVAEGTVTHHPKRDAQSDLFNYFLFNDKILLAVKHSKKLKLRDTLDLVSTEIKDVLDSSTVKNAFELITAKSNYLLAMPTLKQKEDFIKDFYLQRSRAAALLSGPKLAVEAQNRDSKAQAAEDEKEKEKEKEERKEKERKEKRERERLEKRQREEREKREQMEAELAKTKAELELARAQAAAATQQARSPPPAEKVATPPAGRAPAPPKPTTTTTAASAPPPTASATFDPEEHCVECRQDLHGKLVKVGTNRWHKACFTCHTCRGPMPEEFNIEGGWPICDPCYESRSATKCPGCHKAILDKFVKWNAQEWHRDCIVCYKCKKPFPTLNDIEVERGQAVHSYC